MDLERIQGDYAPERDPRRPKHPHDLSGHPRTVHGFRGGRGAGRFREGGRARGHDRRIALLGDDGASSYLAVRELGPDSHAQRLGPARTEQIWFEERSEHGENGSRVLAVDADEPERAFEALDFGEDGDVAGESDSLGIFPPHEG